MVSLSVHTLVQLSCREVIVRIFRVLRVEPDSAALVLGPAEIPQENLENRFDFILRCFFCVFVLRLVSGVIEWNFSFLYISLNTSGPLFYYGLLRFSISSCLSSTGLVIAENSHFLWCNVILLINSSLINIEDWCPVILRCLWVSLVKFMVRTLVQLITPMIFIWRNNRCIHWHIDIIIEAFNDWSILVRLFHVNVGKVLVINLEAIVLWIFSIIILLNVGWVSCPLRLLRDFRLTTASTVLFTDFGLLAASAHLLSSFFLRRYCLVRYCIPAAFNLL